MTGPESAATFILLGASLIYFLPTIVAGRRNPEQMGSTLFLNFFLGWTVMGWLMALVYACQRPRPPQVQFVYIEAPAQVDPSAQVLDARSAVLDRQTRR